jgi:hypothetical protein
MRSLGLKEEGRFPLNTDHPNMCRFESLSDPNYVQIRDALASTFEEVIEERKLTDSRSDATADI